MAEETRDERLRRLGRDWFAEVRRESAEQPHPPRRRDGSDGGGDGDLLDWLFGGEADDCGTSD